MNSTKSAFPKSGHLGQVRTSSDNNELSSRKEVDAVDLISYAKALQPYISESKKKAEYISVIFSNFIDDDSIGGCSFFELEPDTLSRFLQSRPLPKDHAQYFYEHRDLNKYADWISDCLTSSDAFEHVEGWLQQNGYPGESASEELAQMLEQIVLSICKQQCH